MLAVLATMPALHYSCIMYSGLHLASRCLPSTCSMFHDCCNYHSQLHCRVDTVLRPQEGMLQKSLPLEVFTTPHDVL